jgi:hypothetical protein
MRFETIDDAIVEINRIRHEGVALAYKLVKAVSQYDIAIDIGSALMIKNEQLVAENQALLNENTFLKEELARYKKRGNLCRFVRFMIIARLRVLSMPCIKTVYDLKLYYRMKGKHMSMSILSLARGGE